MRIGWNWQSWSGRTYHRCWSWLGWIDCSRLNWFRTRLGLAPASQCDTRDNGCEEQVELEACPKLEKSEVPTWPSQEVAAHNQMEMNTFSALPSDFWRLTWVFSGPLPSQGVSSHCLIARDGWGPLGLLEFPRAREEESSVFLSLFPKAWKTAQTPTYASLGSCGAFWRSLGSV